MPQRLPKSMWFAILLVAVVMGIGSGIIFMPSNSNGWIIITGWAMIPGEIIGFIIDIFKHNMSDMPNQGQLLIILVYLFAMLGYSACAYWTMRYTGSMSKGLTVLIAATCVSTLASLLIGTIGGTIYQGAITSQNFLFMLSVMLSLHIYVFINLFISAVLGWLIAAGLTRRYRRNIHMATAAAYERSGDKTLPL